jgi:hypothetical protein
MSSNNHHLFTTFQRRKAAERDITLNGPILFASPSKEAADAFGIRIRKPAFSISQILSSLKAQHEGGNNDISVFFATEILVVDDSSAISLEVIRNAPTNLS